MKPGDRVRVAKRWRDHCAARGVTLPIGDGTIVTVHPRNTEHGFQSIEVRHADGRTIGYDASELTVKK